MAVWEGGWDGVMMGLSWLFGALKAGRGKGVGGKMGGKVLGGGIGGGRGVVSGGLQSNGDRMMGWHRDNDGLLGLWGWRRVGMGEFSRAYRYILLSSFLDVFSWCASLCLAFYQSRRGGWEFNVTNDETDMFCGLRSSRCFRCAVGMNSVSTHDRTRFLRKLCFTRFFDVVGLNGVLGGVSLGWDRVCGLWLLRSLLIQFSFFNRNLLISVGQYFL